MKVLVACEFSGIVRDAFIARGHNAISCDIIESEKPGPHILGDALQAIRDVKPDLLIAHPPCTFLANSGVRWLYGGKGTERDPKRWHEMRLAADFFGELLIADVEHVAVENPIMHRYGRELIERYSVNRPANAVQTVQPWQYGHGEVKATQFWLRGLPPLVPTNIVTGRDPRVHFASPGPERWKERSRTFTGIAAAMAEQWGGYVQRELGADRLDSALRQLRVERLADELDGLV